VRVALVAPFVSTIADRGAQMGGSQAVLADLGAGLAARGHDVTLLAARRSHVGGVRIPDLGIDADPSASVGTRAERRSASQERAFAAVRAWLDHDAQRPEVIHAHAFDAPAFEQLRGLGALHTLHLPPLDDAVVAAARAADATLATVSPSCQADWRAAGVAVDVILPNGVDLNAIPLGSGAGRYLAFCGRMSPEKGADVACRVARAVGMPLRLAGPVYDQTYFSTVVSPLLGGDVVYLGALDRASVWRLLGDAALALFPVDWNEAFGMAALESLACGTPVAGFRRGGLTELVTEGRTGTLAAPGDEGALAEAVRASLGLSRDECRESARRYDLAHMLDAHEAVYRRLVS
jgi:glycosyltransferase involved in cell wall biosynthesis